jgi:TatD DNase family protein
MAKDSDNNNNGGGNKPRREGFLAGLNKAVKEISAEIRKDLSNAPPTPMAGKGGEGAPLPAAASFKAPEHLAKTVGAAQGGLAFVETPGIPGGNGGFQAPLVPPAARAPLNPWQVLREAGSHKMFLTDAYFHAYTPADLNHYRGELPAGVQTITLACAEAGDAGLRAAFAEILRQEPGMFGATGFSPRNVQDDIEAMDATLTGLLNNNPKLLAVGPVGIDLTYTSHNLPHQAAQMARQLEIAYDFGLPALVFQNGALAELREILERGISLPKKLVWLKPIQGEDELALIEEYNFYVAFRAELTWPKETFYREAARRVLPHRWLAGAGNSLKTTHNRAGHFNSAAGLEEIISTLAELTNVKDVNQLRDRLNMNFAQVYGPQETGNG